MIARTSLPLVALAASLACLVLAVPAAAHAPIGPAPAAGAAQAAPPPTAAQTLSAREHFFGAENVDATGLVRRDRVIVSWFSVGSLAMAIDGRVVLLDTYIHKGEDQPNYVPTTTDELAALAPVAIFVGHGHFDHANTGGELAVRTGAVIVGTPEHCDQAKAQAEAYTGAPAPVRCVEAVSRASAPGAEMRDVRPLGPEVAVTVFKHLHSAAVAPDGENHETSLARPAVPDVNQLLLHPPGAGTVAGLASDGDEGSSLLYQFRIGRFSLTWHDSVGPLREQGPELFKLLEALPPTDVELGSTLGFNDPTNGQRDPVDYMVRIKPKIFFPLHHDFIAEYGVSKGLEGVFRRELAKRPPVATEVRWLYDPFDYLRPSLMTFEVTRDPVSVPGAACLRTRLAIGARSIGKVALGHTAKQLVRGVGVAPVSRTAKRLRWCVQGQRGTVSAVLNARGRSELVATTAATHRTRGIRPGARTASVRRAYRGERRLGRSLLRTGRTGVVVLPNGGVRAIARTTLRPPAALRRALRRAGL